MVFQLTLTETLVLMPPADAILEVSFVGFSTQDVPVNGQDNLTITLATDNELDEVIVTGYGSQKKKKSLLPLQ